MPASDWETLELKTLDILEGNPSLGELKAQGWFFVKAENGLSHFKRARVRDLIKPNLEYKRAYDD